MGLFGGSSPFDSEVEKATNENNTSEQWGLILDICDKASKSPEDARNCLKALFRRLNNSDPHIAIQAATLLDACVSNCGKVFHIEIASRTFEDDYCKLLKKAHLQVVQKLKESLKKWAEGEFKSDPQLNLIPSLYVKLKNSGIDFSSEMPAKKTVALSKDPNVVQSQDEEDQIAKAIELSLKETSGSPKTTSGTTSSLYPTNLGSSGLGIPLNSTSGAASVSAPAKEARKVRALYDFEAAEDNELTFSAGEIILIIDDADANWWKGSNQRGEGLFPANFVSSDLSVEPEQLIYEKAKKMAQSSDNVNTNEEKEPEEIEINEEKVDRLLHLLHEADPTNAEHDSAEMLKLEREVVGMGPLIDTELERVDRKHAQLTQLSSDLVEALNLYHTLMREPQLSVVTKVPYGYPQNTQPPSMMYNGPMPSLAGIPPSYMGAYNFHPGHGSQDRQYMQGPPGSIMQLPPGLPPPRQMPQGSLPPHAIMQNLTGPPGSHYGQQPQNISNYGPQSIPPGFPPASLPQVTQIGTPNTTQPQSGHYQTPASGPVM